MGRFEFTDDLLTGMPDIDGHHRVLIALANEVTDPDAVQTSSKLFLEALAKLARYVLYHFAAEEHVMKRVAYPRLEQHHKWHERWRAEVAELVLQAETGGDTKQLRLLVSFSVEHWLLEHIRIMDKELARFLQAEPRGAHAGLPGVQELKRAGTLPPDFEEHRAGP